MQSQETRDQLLQEHIKEKPPKTENNENVCPKHQRKHVRNVKQSLFSGNCKGEGLVISMDDKAYLRPGTDGELIHVNCRTNNFLITVMPLPFTYFLAKFQIFPLFFTSVFVFE